jgi:putative phage-type endonuclease
MKIHKIEQGTGEWFEIRKAKMTGSHAQAIGNNGRGLDTYIYDLMAESYSSGEKDNYSNKDIERGLELEEFARDMYELETEQTVEQVGFVEMNEFAGVSPDGLVGEDGGIEIKCLNDTKHFKMILNGEKEIESKYIWQIQMCLLVTDRKWWDFISYNPNFEKSLIVFRIKKDDKKQEKLKEGLKNGELKIKEIQCQITKKETTTK